MWRSGFFWPRCRSSLPGLVIPSMCPTSQQASRSLSRSGLSAKRRVSDQPDLVVTAQEVWSAREDAELGAKKEKKSESEDKQRHVHEQIPRAIGRGGIRTRPERINTGGSKKRRKKKKRTMSSYWKKWERRLRETSWERGRPKEGREERLSAARQQRGSQEGARELNAALHVRSNPERKEPVTSGRLDGRDGVACARVGTREQGGGGKLLVWLENGPGEVVKKGRRGGGSALLTRRASGCFSCCRRRGARVSRRRVSRARQDGDFGGERGRKEMTTGWREKKEEGRGKREEGGGKKERETDGRLKTVRCARSDERADEE